MRTMIKKIRLELQQKEYVYNNDLVGWVKDSIRHIFNNDYNIPITIRSLEDYPLFLSRDHDNTKALSYIKYEIYQTGDYHEFN